MKINFLFICLSIIPLFSYAADKCTCPTGFGQSEKPIHQISPNKKQGIMICNLEKETDEITLKSETYLPMYFAVYRCEGRKPLLIFDNVHEECCSLKKDKASFTLIDRVSTITTNDKYPLEIAYTVYYPNGATMPTVKAELVNEDRITKEMLSRPLLGEFPDSNKLGLFIKVLQGDSKANKMFLKLMQSNKYDGAAGQEFSAYKSTYDRFVKLKKK